MAYVRESEHSIEFWVVGHYVVIDSLSQAGEVLHSSLPVLHQDLRGQLPPQGVQRVSVRCRNLHKQHNAHLNTRKSLIENTQTLSVQGGKSLLFKATAVDGANAVNLWCKWG